MRYEAPIGAADPNDPYVDGNPGLGVQGSAVPAAAIEHSMREIVYVITAAGLTPNPAVLTQLHQAIAALIAANVAPDASTTVKGIVELTTNSEALDGSDSTRAVTSAALASSKSYTTDGYQKLPGGLILQWGRKNSVSAPGSAAVTFPVAFPTAVRGILLTPIQSAVFGTNNNVVAAVKNDFTTSGFTILGDEVQGAVSIDCFWFAIGN